MKIDLLRKLTSRKFWIALAGLFGGLVIALGGSAETAETVTGCIMSGLSTIAYIIGEGLTDMTHVNDSTKEE